MTSISIVTKTYNRCAFLQECMRSVAAIRNEPYDNQIQWEHVIYDDGSSDDTPDYCKSHPFSHVRYIRSEENEGVSIASNKAISACDSEWIFELDSDDYVPSRVLANFCRVQKENADAMWFVMDFFRVDATGKYEVGNDYYGWDYQSPKEVLEAIFRGEHFIQRNVFYKRSLWSEVGCYRPDVDMAEDLDLYIRFLLAGNMPIYVPTISHFHRNHEGNLSKGQTHQEHMKELKKLANFYAKPLEEMGVSVRP